MSEETRLLGEISHKLDRVVAVLAAQGKDKDTQAEILALAGIDSTFIGVVLGLTSGRVRQLNGWKRAKEASGLSGVVTEETPPL